MALIYCYGDNPKADHMAKETAETLVATYPNHSWWVEVKGGVLIIKHMEASGSRCIIGMLRHITQLHSSYKERKKEILRAAGELLERARLPRGPRGDDPVTSLDLTDQDAKVSKMWHRPLIKMPTIH